MKSHALKIEILSEDECIYLAIKVTGKLTHLDYEKITPMIDEAVQEHKDANINVLFDGTEMVGWEARAMWDDLKLGLKHGKRFHNIAIVGHQFWMEIAAKIGGWFVGGKVHYFDDSDSALLWLKQQP
ncbi:STAS/SEC14 domain-containing protein [Thalassotalea aquiviva]|uniref:STAS/SEC14 domain-containing protein n=1 Tax=Thalassotalea aquiviva TaxID=3242415 RepID=UPI00352A9073